MRVVIALPGSEGLAADLARRLDGELGSLDVRQFPDGESYVRLMSDVAGRAVFMVCTLAHPDSQVLRLLFAARAARAMGAARVTLVAPYLAYMRQDKQFQPGEAVTSRHFADLISRDFDALVTVDPHLHRFNSLSQIYSIPSTVAHAAPLLAAWIVGNVPRPLLIGPDSESKQWLADVAARAGAEHVVLRKTRRGDRDVEIAIPSLSQFGGLQPVLIDDIVSSGRTMIEAAQGLQRQGFPPPICVITHAIFAEDAFERLSRLARRIVSSDTIPHPSNAISVAGLLAVTLRGATPGRSGFQSG